MLVSFDMSGRPWGLTPLVRNLRSHLLNGIDSSESPFLAGPELVRNDCEDDDGADDDHLEIR